MQVCICVIGKNIVAFIQSNLPSILVVLSYLTAAQSTAAALWIGATAGTATTGNWKWTTNGDTSQSTFPYSNWATTAGDGSIAAADPAFMYTDGTWKYLTDVASKYGSLCEGTATAATSGQFIPYYLPHDIL